MSIRNTLFGLTALAALVMAGPSRAGEFDKYIPDTSTYYMHINVPKVFTSELVRKTVPMAFDKYGESLIGLAAMAKQFNPNAPEITDEQMKEVLKQLSDPKAIAAACDVAKEVVTDVVITGSPTAELPSVVVLMKSQHFSVEMLEMMSNFAGAVPQMKMDKVKKSKGTVYVVSVAPAENKFYLTVPEAGIFFMTNEEKLAEASFEAKSKPSEKLAGLIAKRDKNDFIFVTGIGEEKDDYTTMAGSLKLDKDVSGKMHMEYKDAEKAAEQAKEMNEKLSDLVERLKGFLGDKVDAFKPHLEKTKATVDGKKVTATMSIPGATVEKLLVKEKE